MLANEFEMDNSDNGEFSNDVTKDAKPPRRTRKVADLETTENNSGTGNIKPKGRRRKTGADTGENTHIPGFVPMIGTSRHLSTLEVVEIGRVMNLCDLTACQVRSKIVDMAMAAQYRDKRDISPPPHIVVILEEAVNKNWTADGHTRAVAADLDGSTTIIADVYRGVRKDAKIVGLELNQGSVPMTLAEKKVMLDEILDDPDLNYTIAEIADMVGLERHTVEKRRKERARGDLIAFARRARRPKSPEEKLKDAAFALVRRVDELGPEVITTALDDLPSNVREHVARHLNGPAAS